MRVVETDLPGVLVIEPIAHEDERGTLFELWRADQFVECGISTSFVQDNVSISRASVLRGLHYQLRNPQAKLISALEGEIFDVAVDVRVGSVSFGRSVAVRLSAENHRQLFVPEGFAHGFAVISERAVVLYKCSALYAPDDQHGVRWDDPEIGIEWPVSSPVVSAKDRAAPTLAECRRDGTLPSS